MNTETKPISEISRRATHILFKELGVVETIRFLNQFSTGHGDYTKERDQWLDDVDIKDVVSQIKAERNNSCNRFFHGSDGNLPNSVRNGLRIECLLKFVTDMVTNDEQNLKLDELAEIFKTEIYQLKPSSKHMSGMNLGRIEPSPSLKYKNAA